MEVWLSDALGFDFQNNKARIYGDGKNKLSWISFKDVAKFVVASINKPQFLNKIVEIGGPESLNPLEVVKIFEDVKNNSFSVELIAEEILRTQMETDSDPLMQSFNGLMLQYAKGDEIDMTKTKYLITDRLLSVRNYAEMIQDAVKAE